MPSPSRQAQPDRRNIKLVVQYDGTNFAGWQRQKLERTVQQCLEEAIAKATGGGGGGGGEKVSVLASGRTDSGVHAERQVVGFRTASVLEAGRFVGAINAYLDEDVAVLSASEAPLDFHAIRDAVGKLYRYTIATTAVRPVLDRGYVHWVRDKLDVAAMRRAARHLVGTHDFNSFRAEGRVEKDTLRTIGQIEFKEKADRLRIFFEGGGFLYMMVRIIVGTLIEVGVGRMKADAIPGIIAARDRAAAGPTAPARGLCLVEVRY